MSQQIEMQVIANNSTGIKIPKKKSQVPTIVVDQDEACVESCMSCCAFVIAMYVLIMYSYIFGLVILAIVSSYGYQVEKYADPWTMFSTVVIFLFKVVLFFCIAGVGTNLAFRLHENGALLGKKFGDGMKKLLRFAKCGSVPSNYKLDKEKEKVVDEEKAIDEKMFVKIVSMEDDEVKRDDKVV